MHRWPLGRTVVAHLSDTACGFAFAFWGIISIFDVYSSHSLASN